MLRDVHPAEVLLKDGTLITGARVFLTNERCIVWALDQKRSIVNRVEFEITETDATASRSTMQEGERFEVFGLTQGLTINKGQGCGCGSPLKALAPPINWHSTKESA